MTRKMRKLLALVLTAMLALSVCAFYGTGGGRVRIRRGSEPVR